MPATYKLAMAAGQDAANRQMKAEGRKSWNRRDWDLAASIVHKLMELAR
jgi:hypothetical protein